MKYMGSKSRLLNVGLRDVIDTTLVGASHFVDLFSGSGAVAVDVAERWSIPVTAVDVQEYARVFAAAVLRSPKVSPEFLKEWLAKGDIPESAPQSELRRDDVLAFRADAELGYHKWIYRAYAGHYFSPHQALVFDELYEALPATPDERDLLLAALLATASDCAAAPGHTAQPFQPTSTALPHIASAWRIDPVARIGRYIADLASATVKCPGRAVRCTAEEFLQDANLRDAVVFCDPPYSEVQYSRFYHVLEGMAVGGWPDVNGSGRAPALSLRYSSEFSSKRHSARAFASLFAGLRKSGATAVLTFPNHLCSNGQSAASLATLAADYFNVSIELLDGRHSSLGANSSSSGGRVAHRDVAEAVLILRPRG